MTCLMYINRFARELCYGRCMSETPFVAISTTPTCQCTTRQVDSSQTPCKCLKTGIVITRCCRRFDCWLFVATSTHLRRVLVVISLFFRCFVFSFVFRLVLYRQTNDERKTNERRTRTERKRNEKRSRTER